MSAYDRASPIYYRKPVHKKIKVYLAIMGPVTDILKQCKLGDRKEFLNLSQINVNTISQTDLHALYHEAMPQYYTCHTDYLKGCCSKHHKDEICIVIIIIIMM
jgi:hypothetical protein